MDDHGPKRTSHGCAGLVAAEADKGEGLRMLVQRAGGNIAETVPKKLPASGVQVRPRLS